MKNKKDKPYGKQGVSEIKGSFFHIQIVDNPLAFANSDRLKKIQNRNRRNKK